MNTHRPLNVIAREIQKDWKKPYFGAQPYLNAMLGMFSVNDRFGWDDGRSVVMYFLANAGTWRGETAKRVKKELNAMIK